KAAEKKPTPPPASQPQNSRPVQPAPATSGSGSTVLKNDQAGANAQNEALASDVLPDGPDYTTEGNGTFRVLPGTTPVVGTGELHRYTVDVENGITGVDLTAFAKQIDKVFADPRSWTGDHSGVALQRVDSGPADFHITLTTPMTVRNLCGYE